MKKWIIGIAAAVLLSGGLVAALVLSPQPSMNKAADTALAEPMPEAQPQADVAEEPAVTPVSDTPALAEGRYTGYSEGEIAASGYDTTVLFFHASWCPECRAFEQAINDSTIPAGVQILKVDYDSSADLRQKYGVTLQSTFVSVNDDGAEVSQWVGYGKDKSVEAILENL